MTDFEFTVFVTMMVSMPLFALTAVLAINRDHLAAWFSYYRYSLRCWLRNIPDRLCIWLAYRVLPKRVVMWCCIRVGAWATTGAYSSQLVPALTFMEALKRWETA